MLRPLWRPAGVITYIGNQPYNHHQPRSRNDDHSPITGWQARRGSFAISVTVTDKDGASATGGTTVQVKNVAPSAVNLARSAASIDLVAKQIEEAGGIAHARVVDALDASAVDAFIASVVHETGSLDIEFNATGPRISEYGNGKAALDLTIEEFLTPVNTVLRSCFITANNP